MMVLIRTHGVCFFLTHILCYDTTGSVPGDISLFIVEKGIEGFNIGQKVEDKVLHINNNK